MRTRNDLLAFTLLYTFNATSTAKNIKKSDPNYNFSQEKLNDITLNLNRFLNIKAIKSLDNLKENWNGYGAHSFDKKTIQRFLSIINLLEIQPKISPTGRKTLVLVYEKTKEEKLSFEIFENKIDCAYLNMKDFSKCYIKQVDENELNQEIYKFYGKSLSILSYK